MRLAALRAEVVREHRKRILICPDHSCSREPQNFNFVLMDVIGQTKVFDLCTGTEKRSRDRDATREAPKDMGPSIPLEFLP